MRYELTKCKCSCINEKENDYASILFSFFAAMSWSISSSLSPSCPCGIFLDTTFLMTLTITIPRGITGKCPPPDQEQPIVPPLNPTITPVSMSQGHGDASIKLFRQMFERTECGNIRIRKLNEFRKQRRLESAGLSNLSDSEEEDLIPCIASFMARRSNLTHIDEALNIATKADTIEPQAIHLLPGIEEDRGPQLEIPNGR